MNHNDLPQAARDIIAEQGWNEQSLHLLFNDFMSESDKPIEEGFRRYCRVVAALEAEAPKNTFATWELPAVFERLGWSTEVVLAHQIAFFRIGTRPELGDALVDFLRDRAKEENEIASRFAP